MPNAPVYKNVIGTFPNRGIAWGSYTTAQINENLLYIIGLITDNTPLELKTALTIDDRADCETHGNIYFLGFPNDPNAVFCLYRTRYNSGTFEIAFDFVDRNNINIQQPNYDRTSRYPSQYGYSFDFTINNANNVFGIAILKADNLFYISAFGQDNNGNVNNVNNSLNSYKVITNGEKLGCWIGSNNKKIRFRQYSANQTVLFFIDLDVNIGSDISIRVDRAYFQNLVDVNNNYIIPSIKLLNSTSGLQETLPSDFIYVLLYSHPKSNNFGTGNIMKIDDKYYLCISSYGNDANMCVYLGTIPVIFE